MHALRHSAMPGLALCLLVAALAVPAARALPAHACPPPAVDVTAPTLETLASGTWAEEAAAEYRQRAEADGATDVAPFAVTGLVLVSWPATTDDLEGWFRAGVRTPTRSWGSPSREASNVIVRDFGKRADAEVVECGDLGWDAPPEGTTELIVETSAGIDKTIAVTGDEMTAADSRLGRQFGPATDLEVPSTDDVEELLRPSRLDRAEAATDSWLLLGGGLLALAAFAALLGALAWSRRGPPDRAGKPPEAAFQHDREPET